MTTPEIPNHLRRRAEAARLRAEKQNALEESRPGSHGERQWFDEYDNVPREETRRQMPKPLPLIDHPVVQFAKKHRWKLLIVAALLALGLVVGCSSVPGTDDYNDKHGVGDAPTGEKDDTEKDVIQFPDGFSNVSHSCDGHGHRVFVTTQNASGKELVVVDDASCGGSG